MANQAYKVQVQSDYLNKITRAYPVQALAELIWNSLDADASKVDVSFDYELDTLSTIIVRDDGHGIPYADAPELFQNLGGSWKRLGGMSKTEGRFLHGQEGRGRFKALALGRAAEWDVTYGKGKDLWTYKIQISAENIQEVVITDEAPAPEKKRRGVVLSIVDPHKDYRVLTSNDGIQELNETFATYLSDYSGVSIIVGTLKLDPSSVIVGQHEVNLSDIVEDNKLYPVRLSLIEWKASTSRALYICNERRLPLIRVGRRFHVGNFQFSAYLSSPFITKFQKENTFDFCEANPLVTKSLDEASQAIKDHFRERAAIEAKTLVDEWKEERVYPFTGEAASQVEVVERQVFDIVAVKVAQYMPDFDATPPKNKALHLRLLRQSIEKSPEDLQFILEEVLNLPKRKQAELAELLRTVSLSAIISAAKVVTDRLKFLDGLESILFDQESKKCLKERSQLHRIVAQNCWLFGEEYSLSVSDQSLTEVLRKHKKILGEDVAIDEPVKHISKANGIIDLMLSRMVRNHKPNELTHLIIELKAPKVKIDKNFMQIEEYAFSIRKDERFRNVKTKWVFWAISDDFGDYVEGRIQDESGLMLTKDNLSIYVKTWGQVLDENRARLQFFKEKLEYEADKGASLQYLRENYHDLLKGVLVEEDGVEEEKEVSAA